MAGGTPSMGSYAYYDSLYSGSMNVAHPSSWQSSACPGYISAVSSAPTLSSLNTLSAAAAAAAAVAVPVSSDSSKISGNSPNTLAMLGTAVLPVINSSGISINNISKSTTASSSINASASFSSHSQRRKRRILFSQTQVCINLLTFRLKKIVFIIINFN